MKTFLTIVSAVVLSVAITLLIQHRLSKPASPIAGDNPQNFVKCGLDANGHIVPDGKGGCIPPPPTGYIMDVPLPKGTVPIPKGAVIEKYPPRSNVSADELARKCPFKAPVSEACQDLYVLPDGVSCIGKPFETCMCDRP